MEPTTTTQPPPARPAVPAPSAPSGAAPGLAVPLTVPFHSTTVPEVRIPAGTRIRLLLDAPVPRSLDALTVWVRGPNGRLPARLTQPAGTQGLAVEIDAALEPGVHELLVTNDDETTQAHHRFRAVPTDAAPSGSSAR